jgi:hypothetical protein
MMISWEDGIWLYLAIGLGICAWARFFYGPPAQSRRYPELIALWPLVLILIIIDRD